MPSVAEGVSVELIADHPAWSCAEDYLPELMRRLFSEEVDAMPPLFPSLTWIALVRAMRIRPEAHSAVPVRVPLKELCESVGVDLLSVGQDVLIEGLMTLVRGAFFFEGVRRSRGFVLLERFEVDLSDALAGEVEFTLSPAFVQAAQDSGVWD